MSCNEKGAEQNPRPVFSRSDMEISKAKEVFKAGLKLSEAYRHASVVMNYDSMTAAPKNAAAYFGADMALLSGEARKVKLDKDFIEAVETLCAHAGELDGITRREAEEEMRGLERIRAIPAEEHAAYRRLLGVSFAKWQEAKRRDDFALFEPYLDEVISACRRMAQLAAPEADPYDYWLNENEEGASTQMLDGFFALLKRELVPLIAAVSEREKPDASFLHAYFPKAEQQKFSLELMDLMGIDRDRCSLGEAEHPYTTFISRSDVRMTTHYYERYAAANMFSVIHEGGHALYELNVGEELKGSPLAHGASAGMHESQSRFYENIIGRSREFAELVLPLMKKHFPEQFSGVDAEGFYRAVNRVEPSLKRTEADELTYCLHIMIRYELEKRLLHGELKAADVPAEWNRLYKEYLGLDVPNDREGCLQDMHWGSGLIGYFPTYALGNAYGAQIAAALEKRVNVWELVRRGGLPEITAVLTEGIYRFGKLKTPAQLIEGFCGEGFEPRYYIEYLKEKYGAL